MLDSQDSHEDNQVVRPGPLQTIRCPRQPTNPRMPS